MNNFLSKNKVTEKRKSGIEVSSVTSMKSHYIVSLTEPNGTETLLSIDIGDVLRKQTRTDQSKKREIVQKFQEQLMTNTGEFSMNFPRNFTPIYNDVVSPISL